MKKEEKLKAIELRKCGWSITRIAKELKISKSSAFNWTRDVIISDEQRNKLFENKGSGWRSALDVWIKKCSDRRLEQQEIGRGEVLYDNWEHVAGCMLWWAEGNKSKNQLVITNTDSNLLKFFVFFIKKYYKVKDNEIALTIHYHKGLEEIDLINYWKTALNITEAKILKGHCKKKKTSKTKYPYGICRITINSTGIVNRIWGSVQEYIGFYSPETLK